MTTAGYAVLLLTLTAVGVLGFLLGRSHDREHRLRDTLDAMRAARDTYMRELRETRYQQHLANAERTAAHRRR